MRNFMTAGRLIGGLLLVSALSGCAGIEPARYVYQDGEFGVVGIPENTDRWPHHYRRQAEALMASHFPEGHEIVRAEEVVEGSRTLKVEGTRTAELAPQLPTELLKVAKLGRTASRSQSDTLDIKECRIIYRRAARPAFAETFAEAPELSPRQYIDPNAAERSKATPQTAATPGKEQPTAGKAKDEKAASS